MRLRKLFELFFAFAQVGVCTFGGGMAMLPILQREIVGRRKWATDAELADYYAIGQCTPGIIAVNTATFIGCRQAGMIGGVVATLGVVSPSVVIITIIAAFLANFADASAVSHAFAGIRACVCALILNAVVKLAKSGIVDPFCGAIFVSVFVASALFGISPTIIVAVAGIVGLSVRLARMGR